MPCSILGVHRIEGPAAEEQPALPAAHTSLPLRHVQLLAASANRIPSPAGFLQLRQVSTDFWNCFRGLGAQGLGTGSCDFWLLGLSSWLSHCAEHSRPSSRRKRTRSRSGLCGRTTCTEARPWILSCVSACSGVRIPGAFKPKRVDISSQEGSIDKCPVHAGSSAPFLLCRVPVFVLENISKTHCNTQTPDPVWRHGSTHTPEAPSTQLTNMLASQKSAAPRAIEYPAPRMIHVAQFG
ncbi:unnamed protein product [Effrenium voratum]|nr:unnamed protein product [Effrenium voratum]